MRNETAVSAELRLSALRAFLGLVRPTMRLIKVKMEGIKIIVTVVMTEEPSEQVREDISIAATEIIADFPSPNTIEERILISTSPLPKEDVLIEGWIYARAE